MVFRRKGPKPLKVDLWNVYPDNLVGFVSCVAGYSESLVDGILRLCVLIGLLPVRVVFVRLRRVVGYRLFRPGRGRLI